MASAQQIPFAGSMAARLLARVTSGICCVESASTDRPQRSGPVIVAVTVTASPAASAGVALVWVRLAAARSRLL